MKDLEKESFAVVQAKHYLQCLQEAKLAAAVFLLAFFYCATAVAMLGYPGPDERPPEAALIWGIPEWVFWGLFLPWLVLMGVTWWFALFFLRDDEPLLPFPGQQADASEIDP